MYWHMSTLQCPKHSRGGSGGSCLLLMAFACECRLNSSKYVHDMCLSVLTICWTFTVSVCVVCSCARRKFAFKLSASAHQRSIATSAQEQALTLCALCMKWIINSVLAGDEEENHRQQLTYAHMMADRDPWRTWCGRHGQATYSSALIRSFISSAIRLLSSSLCLWSVDQS